MGVVWELQQLANEGLAYGNYHFHKGRYLVGVWARQVGSIHAYDSYAIITFYVV